MEKITFLPITAQQAIKIKTKGATEGLQAIFSALDKHDLPTTIEEVAKALKSPSYLRDDAVAEAENYAKRTKAPETLRAELTQKAFDSIPVEMVADLANAVSKWVDEFTPADFEQNDFGAWVLSADAVERLTATHRVVSEGEDLALAHRLRAFISEYKDLCAVFNVESLECFSPLGDTPPLESFCDTIFELQRFKADQAEFERKQQERRQRRASRV